MGKTFGWRSLLLVLAAACSGESVTAPGACPAFCTGITVQASDSILRASVRGDSTYFGYVSPQNAAELVIAGPGSAIESRAVLRFYAFTDTVRLNATDTTKRPVAQTDSFQLSLKVGRRSPNVTDMRVALYRLPPTVDSLATAASLAPYFQDSTFLLEFPVPANRTFDSLVIGFSPALLPTFLQDSLNVTIGVALRSASPAFVALGSAEAVTGALGAVMNRFIKIDSLPGTRVDRVESLGTLLDMYVFTPPAPPGPGVLAVGSSPSARTFIRLDLPRRIVDSTNVVRATLLLIPASPAIVPPGDTLVIVAHGLAADIGPKSPLQGVVADSGGRTGARVVAGSTDTIRVDITNLFRSWRADTTLDRALVLRVSPEGSSFGEVRFWSTSDPAKRPVIDVTYVPPVKYQGQ